MAPRVWNHCRVCGNEHLRPVISLGDQPLSGVFVNPNATEPPRSPLELVRCASEGEREACGTVQLRHSADLASMYGATYGYASSISPTMAAHLDAKVRSLRAFVSLTPGDTVLDIGCNDGTLLNAYGAETALVRVGMDPSSGRFLDCFQPDIQVGCDFFSAQGFWRLAGDRTCRIVTSIAMFYDLDDPLTFMREVRSILAHDGVWEVELSYLMLLLEQLTYDQICHEHVTYLGIRQMDWMIRRCGLRLLDVALNDVNGGSFSLRVGRDDGPYQPNEAAIGEAMLAEARLQEDGPFDRFRNRVLGQRDDVRSFFAMARAAGSLVCGYGASTKGNVVLSYCGLGVQDIPMICDRTPEKHGLLTPGSRIPIVSQATVRARKPDYLFVMIRPFRSEVIRDELDFLRSGGRLVFGLPRLHVVDGTNYERYLSRPFQDLAYSL